MAIVDSNVWEESLQHRTKIVQHQTRDYEEEEQNRMDSGSTSGDKGSVPQHIIQESSPFRELIKHMPCKHI